MSKPLEGIRILELAGVLAVPAACMLLADLGAEVIKIEQPGVGDISRNYGPYFRGGESLYFMCMNRNKKSLTLNLKSTKGQEIFYNLVKKSDVVFEGYRPKAINKLKIDYHTLKKINPQIVYCSLTGFGLEGPKTDKPSFDPVIQAETGMMAIMGEPGRPPVLCAIPIADVSAGHMAAIGIEAALLERVRTGEGKCLEIAMADTLTFMFLHYAQFYINEGKIPGPVGSGHPTNIPVRALLTKDGRYIQIYCAPQKFFENFISTLAKEDTSLQDLLSDSRFVNSTKRFENKEALYNILDQVFLTRTSDEWIKMLEKADIPCAKIKSFEEAFQDPQIALRNMIVEIDHPSAGKIKTLGNPIKTSSLNFKYGPSPVLGQHNLSIMTQILGYTTAEIAEFQNNGII